MTADHTKVECKVHGEQEEAFACQHIANSLLTGVPVGFFWPEESNQKHPDAWCQQCEDARVEAGGDWTPEVEKLLSVKLLCGACYEYAKSIWENGRKLTQ